MKKFLEESEILRKLTLDMGYLALNMLNRSIEAFKLLDKESAIKIIEDRLKLSEYDTRVENESIRLLTLYQPVAKDLRTIACSLKLNTYFDRVGRYGKNIAQITAQIDTPHFKKIISIPHMMRIVETMITDVIEAFQTNCFSKLTDIRERDNEVDELRYSIFRECIAYMIEDPTKITLGTHYIMVARYLERVGDHACKAAEKIYYMIYGKHVEIK